MFTITDSVVTLSVFVQKNKSYNLPVLKSEISLVRRFRSFNLFYKRGRNFRPPPNCAVLGSRRETAQLRLTPPPLNAKTALFFYSSAYDRCRGSKCTLLRLFLLHVPEPKRLRHMQKSDTRTKCFREAHQKGKMNGCGRVRSVEKKGTRLQDMENTKRVKEGYKERHSHRKGKACERQIQANQTTPPQIPRT